jgi:outer membrane protein assembly factor BamB
MKTPANWLVSSLVLVCGLSFTFVPSASAQSFGWPQFGGPNRNFKSDSKGLASSWPAAGPRRLWMRDLGEGYSAIVSDGPEKTSSGDAGRLYTMYRVGDEERVIALDAATGKTIWEYGYAAPFLKGMDMGNGPGPHSTPLVVDKYVFAAGVTSKLNCLDKRTGKLVWSHDLWKEFNGTLIDTGYSCSPLAYKNTVILMLGGKGTALIAFDQKDGSVVWKKQDFTNSPSSPILINLEGQYQLVAFLANEVAGFDPANGDLLWSHPHVTRWNLNVSMPVWGEDNLLFCSSAYDVGSRVLQLGRIGNKTEVKELWASKRVRVHKDNAIRLGDYVYASSGDFGPAFFTALEVRTGRVAWQDRGFSKASFLYADGKFIILDEDGNLGLAAPSSTGLKVLAKVELLKQNAWTVPALVGTRLFVRDRKTIMALELGG